MVGDVRICGWLNGVCEVRKREKRIHIWPSWILVRLITVCGEKDCSIV